jgi:indolepyruvate ferredoxin oxidoreductase beta subunit
LVRGWASEDGSLGMSQRADVVSFVRWGEQVYSPLPGGGLCDVVLALEKLEAARGAPLDGPDSPSSRVRLNQTFVGQRRIISDDDEVRELFALGSSHGCGRPALATC